MLASAVGTAMQAASATAKPVSHRVFLDTSLLLCLRTIGVASRSVRFPKQPDGVEVNRSGYPGRSRRAKSTDRPRAGMAYCRRPTTSAAIMNSAVSAANGVVPRSNTSALEPAPRRLKSVWTKRSDGVIGALAVAARGLGVAPALSKPRGPCGAVRILAADSLE